MKKILVPVDFSDHSLHALEIASGVAADQDTTLALVHIWTSQVSFNESSPPAVVLAAQEAAARRRLEELRPPRPKVKVERYLSVGAPDNEIIRYVQILTPDVIVMGTYGQTGVSHRVVGSVAEAVMARVACPVLICKLPVQSMPRPVARSAPRFERDSSRRSGKNPERVS